MIKIRLAPLPPHNYISPVFLFAVIFLSLTMEIVWSICIFHIVQKTFSSLFSSVIMVRRNRIIVASFNFFHLFMVEQNVLRKIRFSANGWKEEKGWLKLECILSVVDETSRIILADLKRYSIIKVWEYREKPIRIESFLRT